MVVVAMVCLLGDAEQALAWGPATHIGLGAGILSQLGLLPPAVAAILLRHRVSYLYGNIAADVVFAKRLSRVKQFCHHWSTAFGLLDAAEDDAGRAFAYGYLSHLAADTVAHGKYVPHQIMVSGGSVNLGHFYWEIRADVTQDDDVWQSLERTMVHDHDHHHEYLKGHMSDTFLPYLLNRRLFHGMNMLAAGRRFRRGVAVWNRCSRWYLSPTLLAGYQSECVDRIQSILSEGRQSALVREDPNGTSALMHAHVRRREARRLSRRGFPVHHRRREASQGLAPKPGCSIEPDHALHV